MIEVINLGKSFLGKKLFQNVNLKFTMGNTYGIIGANGVGKTTFLKILEGIEDPSIGQVIKQKGARVSALEQNYDAYSNFNVLSIVISGNKELKRIEETKNKIYNNPDATSQDYEQAAELEDQFGQMGGWTAESDAEILLKQLNVAIPGKDTLLKELKANDKTKVLLARALFGNPDILLLDEPTNHLDLKTIKWLENFLADYKNLVLVVSHDIDFLDQVCTNMVDIDFGQARMFSGNYSFWKESSQLALELQQKQNMKKDMIRKQLESFIKRFSANASKSAQATSRKKALEKIEVDEIIPSNRKYPYINFGLSRETGKNILKVNRLTLKNNQNTILLNDLSFSLTKNEKVAVIGADDLTKTQFLETLMGIFSPSIGTVEWGITVTPNYFPNNHDNFFQNNENLLDWISKWPVKNKQKINKDNSDSRMRSFLGRMLFSGDMVFKKVKDCSGGEKVRLMLAKMMLEESNFLLMDQPLDHLDTETIMSVIEGLQKYNSNVIFASYNRALIKNVANVILDLEKEVPLIFRGTLEEYEEKMGY